MHETWGQVKRCNSDGCTNEAIKGGVCWRHGAYRNTNDESTAFGSELFEKTTVTQALPKSVLLELPPEDKQAEVFPER